MIVNICPHCDLPAVRRRRLEDRWRWWCIRDHEWSTEVR